MCASRLQWGRCFDAAERAYRDEFWVVELPHFNGAAALMQRKGAFAALEDSLHCHHFNGAAALMQRKVWSSASSQCEAK